MKKFLQGLLCTAGFHAWRERKNGKGTERVCMRDGCNCKRTFYKIEDGEFSIWAGKRIPVGKHTFKKSVRGK